MWTIPELTAKIFEPTLVDAGEKLDNVCGDFVDDNFVQTNANYKTSMLNKAFFTTLIKLALLDLRKDERELLGYNYYELSIESNTNGEETLRKIRKKAYERTPSIDIFYLTRGKSYKSIFTQLAGRRRDIEFYLQQDSTHMVRVFERENCLKIVTSEYTLPIAYKIHALYIKVFPQLLKPRNERTICHDLISAIVNNNQTETEKLALKYLELNPRCKINVDDKIMKLVKNINEARAAALHIQVDRAQREYNNACVIVDAAYKKYCETTTNFEAICNGTQNQIAIKEFLETMDQHRYVAEYTINATSIELNIIAPLRYVDEDCLEDYYTSKHDQPGYEILYRSLIKHEFNIYTVANIKIDLLTNDVSTGAPISAVQNRLLLQHPHLMRYYCWGNHLKNIRAFLAHQNWIGAVEQIMYACENINLYDGVVMRHFIPLLDTVKTTAIPTFTLPGEKEFMTWDKLQEKLIEEETNEATRIDRPIQTDGSDDTTEDA